ncbi:Uncharacterized protein OBRU01_12233, partial [Operophtera brumata]
PIDPQETTYCVVASHHRNYTSLCAAQHDIKISRYEKTRMIDAERILSVESSTEVDNKIEVDDGYSLFEGNLKNVFRRKKTGRSTKVSDEDPVIACVGDRTHHLIENLDPTRILTQNSSSPLRSPHLPYRRPATRAPSSLTPVLRSRRSDSSIVQKIFGLKAGRKYAIQVLASNRGSAVPYNVLYVDTNVSCKD